MLNLLKISGGGILQNLIATSSWIFLVRIISESGPAAVAGYTIAIRIIIFVLLPAWGLSNAASTLVGQNLGAKQPDRAERSVWITANINAVMMGIISVFLILFPETWILLFINDTTVVAEGAYSLKIISFGFIFYAIGMVLVQGFNGSGDTITPTKINLVSFWLIEIPIAYLLAIILGYGLAGASISVLIGESSMTIISFIIFKKGKWKTREV